MRHLLLRKLILASLILFLSLLFYSIDSAAQVRLAWNPNTESDLGGYRIYYGTASRSYGSPVNVGRVTSYPLTGLSPGVRYYFAVTAYDTADNESGFSSEVSYTPPAGCTYAISPASQSAGSSGGPGTVSVTTSSGCAWTAASNVSWITLTSNSSVTGPGTVNYSVSAISGTASRTGTITVAGRTFTVTQSGSGSSSGWVFCANENQQCSFTGTKIVRYGTNGVYFFETLANGTMCSNGVFGDPLPGVPKQCYIF